MSERSTHVLVPETVAEGLRSLSRCTRVCQSVYLREAVSDLLEANDNRVVPLVGEWPREGDRLVSVVFRVEEGALEMLAELSGRTRVRQSEYLREAIWLLLEKHGARQ